MSIPPAWTDAVRLALKSAFGVDAPEGVQPLTGGLSGAPVLRVEVNGARYVMRLDPPVEGLGDPSRWHGCMRTAAEAGVAPRVHYVGTSGVSIVDYIEHDPSAAYAPENRAALLDALGRMLGRLHAAPAFPPLVDYLDGMDDLIGRVRAGGHLGSDEAAVPLDRFATLAQAYRGLPPQRVASHNDVNPRNLVHDGKRPWLIDWLSAFQADRYTDLASVASFFAPDDATVGLLLKGYFGAEPSRAQRARFHLARQINHTFYAMTMLTTSGAIRPERVRALDALHLALRTGEPVMDTAEGRAEYARARLAAMVAGVESPRFAEAVRLAA